MRCWGFWGLHKWEPWSKAVLKRLVVTFNSPIYTSTPFEEDVWFQERRCSRCGLAQHRNERPR